MAISYEPSPEVGEPPGGGEEFLVSEAISIEPGPEVYEPPSTLPPFFASSSVRSGNPFSSPVRESGSFHKALFASLRSVPNCITQEQQSRPCFAFSLEEDE